LIPEKTAKKDGAAVSQNGGGPFFNAFRKKETE
jgi:hypothetical protein